MALTTEQTSAKAVINDFLGTYGLSSLADTVWTWYLAGTPMEQIMLDIRKTPEYKQRFPAMEALGKQGMAISEADYINFERQATGLFRAYGLPPGFYDSPDDFSQFLTNQVSVAELEERLKLRAVAMFQSPPETRAELQRLFGVTAGDLTAYWTDPDKAFPLLQQQFASAQVAGAADSAHFGALTRAEAEGLAQRGVTADQAAKGFGLLEQSSELLHALPGEAGYAGMDRSQQFGAAFGYDPQAALELQREADKRKAALEAGGQYVTTTKGVEGLTPPQ